MEESPVGFRVQVFYGTKMTTAQRIATSTEGCTKNLVGNQLAGVLY
jgi:hypothetical protein